MYGDIAILTQSIQKVKYAIQQLQRGETDGSTLDMKGIGCITVELEGIGKIGQDRFQWK
jgi:hypothetical protein